MPQQAHTRLASYDPATPAEWEEFRSLARRMVDDSIDRLRDLGSTPPWQKMPDEVRTALTSSDLPLVGSGLEHVYGEFQRLIAPYTNGNRHPRFFGWVQGNGTPVGMMADMLAPGLNPHMAGFDQAPALVEEQLLDWLARALGMPGASGLMVSGATMANTIGLTTARHAALKSAGRDPRRDRLQSWSTAHDTPKLVCYGSAETHGWARRSTELLGLGHRAFREAGVNRAGQVDVDELRRMIAQDRAAGEVPFCVIGTAGSVNTGTSDDLAALADLCRTEGLWFHVDGAFGALAYLSERLRHQVKGLERADSVGFDLHKWGFLPFECACVLVRDRVIHHEAFAYDTTKETYLAGVTRGIAAGGLRFAERGPELTRNFRALKAWMSLKVHGIEHLVRVIEQTVEQTRYLAQAIESHPNLELLAPASLNIVCFRFIPAEQDRQLTAANLHVLNAELLIRLQEQGIAVLSSVVIRGADGASCFALRAANVNHRTTWSDLDALIEGVIRIGRQLLSVVMG